MQDVVGAEPGNPSERLCIKKDEQGGNAVLERHVVVVDELSQQREPLVLGERGGIACGAVRDGGLRHVFGPHRPPQEGVVRRRAV
ncbi:hypothetical protein [Streptomyces sp. NPDC001851]|uniref:hypothetical protein n=1 Tax=Streptomyces sp. NPDC001851 TaxID=3154529 RepID=UPI00332A1BC0